MKSSNVLRIAACLSIVGALGLFGMTSCSNSSAPAVDPEAIAATMDDYELKESVVTNYIENFRASQNLTEEENWGMWLAQYGMTPEAIREDTINSFMDMELVRILAKQEGVTVEDAEIDEQVESMKAKYSDENAWNDALAQAGLTEELYRESVEAGLLDQKLSEKIMNESNATVTDEDLLEAASQYAAAFNGAKKTSHILFAKEDKETAEKVLEQLKNNEITFEDAVSQYSTDEGSKAKGGDVGWNMLNSFVEEYTTGMEPLEKDQMSDLVESTYGYHIIKVTDVYVAPEGEITSLDQVPTELVDYLRTMLDSSKKSEAYSTWFNEQKEKHEVKINEMPKDVPYNVDIEKYQKELEALTSSSSEDTHDHDGEEASGSSSASSSADSSASSSSASSASASSSSEASSASSSASSSSASSASSSSKAA